MTAGMSNPSAAHGPRLNADHLRVIVATVLFSFVGPVSKLVALGVGTISFYRASFATLALAAVMALRSLRSARRPFLAVLPAPRAALELIGLGLLLAGNWYFYVLAIQVSSVVVAVVSLFTYPLITALIEPLVFGQRYRALDLFAGCVVFSGILLVVDHFSLKDASVQGVACGLLASVSITLRNLFSRRALAQRSAQSLNLAQFMVAVLVFAPFLMFERDTTPSLRELVILVIIGGVLTAASWVLFTAALRGLTTTVASFLVSLQPVIATGIAWLLLDERPHLKTLAGGVVILAGVVIALYQPAGRAAEPREPAAE